MRKIVVFIIFMFMFISVDILNASLYRGQKNFQKNCRACHGVAIDCIDKKSVSEWDSFFTLKAKKLRKAHADSNLTNIEKASLSKYFNSTLFSRTIKHYRQFFMHYAKDSDNVLTCD